MARAGGASLEAKRRALAELIERYRPALMKFLVVSRGIRRDTAEDLVQGFLTDKILEKDLIARAEQSRGRLRSFLRQSLRNYAIDRLRRRRGEALPVDEHLDAAAPGGPADAFDRAWAREVMRETYRRMELRLQAGGRLHVWRVFEDRVIRPTEEASRPTPSRELARRLGLKSAKQVDNAFVTARRMMKLLLVEVVGEYAPPEDVDAEIAELLRLLGTRR